VEKMISEVDKKGEGKIDFEGFKKMMQGVLEEK